MELSGKLGAWRVPDRLIGWLSAALLAVFAVTAAPELAYAQCPPNCPVDLGSSLMNRNRAILILANGVGQAGSIASGSSVGSGGFWPVIQNPYIFAAGLTLGATIPNGDGDGNAADTVAFIGGPFSQVRPGGTSLGDEKLWNDPSGAGIVWNTAIPGAAEVFPAECTVDATRVEQFPTLSPFEDEPMPGFADQVGCMAVNDVQDCQQGGDCRTAAVCDDCGGKRMGVEVVSTWWSFAVPAVQDFVFVSFRVFNRSSLINAGNSPSNPAGPYDLSDLSVSIAIDPDVGDSGDDQITFLPDVQTMIYWDAGFSEPAFVGTPGVGAVTYLQTPVDPITGEEVGLANFSVFSRSAGRPDPESPQEWYEILSGDPAAVLFEIEPTDIRGVASSGLFDLPAGEFVEIYGAFFFAPPFGTPPAELLAQRPCRGNPCTAPENIIEGANDDPVLTNIKRLQPTAQAVFNAGFIVPTAPPRPEFELVPGDQQVTILWGGQAVEAVNPFAKVARDPFARLGTGEPDPDAPGIDVILGPGTVIFLPERDEGGTTGFLTAADAGLVGFEVTNPAFNPDFLIQDFQGFRVYRSRTGDPVDAELIAQFDLADAITGGTFCVDAVEVRDPETGDVISVVCVEEEDLAIGEDTGLGFAVTDRGGNFPNPSNGPGLINGIPVFYSVTSFAVNPGQTPVSLPPEGFDLLTLPPAPLVLESGISPMRQAIPRTEASSFVGATVGDAEIIDGAGNVVEPQPFSGDELPSGPIPAAVDGELSVGVIQPTQIPADFTAIFRIDSMPVSPGFGHPNSGCTSGELLTAAGCVFGIEGIFDEIPAGDNRSRQVWFSVTDGDGNVLETPTGPAQGVFLTEFISFTGVTDFSSPEVQIVSPIDPSAGVAFTLQYSSRIGHRGLSCPINGDVPCTLVDQIGGGLPASVSEALFSRSLYGQARVADVEITWSNQAGELGLSQVRDISNNVDLFFTSGYGTEQWGFSRPTGLAGPEDELATAVNTARTADGKVLFPDPFCSAVSGGFPANCVLYGFLAAFTQSEPVFTDLPVKPDVFEALAPFQGQYAAVPWHQPEAHSETATLVNVDGQQGTRLYISGHNLDLVFNQLPADGETWTIRLPLGSSGGNPPPRPLVPGMAMRVNIQGGTNEPATADLSEIAVVPNPFFVASSITRGSGQERILFNNLPPRATIRIYTISGNLVRVLEHSDGSGTAEWDVRTRFDLLAASGNYYFHVTTPEGRTHLGRFAIVN